MSRVLYWRSFYRKKIWRIYWLQAHCPGNIDLNLIQSTYSKSLLAIEPPAFLLYLIYDDVIVYYQNTEVMKAN